MNHAEPLDRSLLTIVVPIYNEAENLPELEVRLLAITEATGFFEHEFLLVSDGSVDRSEAMIRTMVENDSRFRGIFLSRNFGHQAAVSIGLEHARGSVVAVIDADLQDPPEAIPDLLVALGRGADVAYGVRLKRKEGVLKRASYFTFYRLLGTLAAIEIPPDAGDFSCMRRRVVDAMLRLPERNRFVRGIRSWVGFTQVGVAYERAARAAGAPKYGLRKLLALAYDGMFSFTRLPIRLIQFLGFILSSAAILVAFGYVAWYFVAPSRFPWGFASLIISIWFFAGVQLLCLGFVGEYVIRTYEESRARPVALIREFVGRPRDRDG
ncbi:glycosyltransferase family 2 protein [Tundrisphaera sp. TA3]|uniref:glycosyltransferase family 2 protein n=1 Tax=Tundrisphaera sp. TA3 TaxID=3435775 RepID=UPI003EBBFD07